MRSGLDYIRKTYGVPAKRGGRVEWFGFNRRHPGTITGARGALLRIRMDGETRSKLFHPTWNLTYL